MNLKIFLFPLFFIIGSLMLIGCSGESKDETTTEKTETEHGVITLTKKSISDIGLALFTAEMKPLTGALIAPAKVQYTEAHNNLEVVKNELTTAFAELNYALGFGKQSYDSKFGLTDSLVFVEHRISLEQIYKSLEETNPQIKIAELNYGIASVEKNLAWSSLLPNINLAYFKQTLDGNSGFYGASFGISVPLWFMFDQRGKIQEAVANQSISESELQLTKNEIALKLKSVFTDYENNLKQVKLYVNDILPQAEEIYRTAVKSYEAGEITYIEFLQA